MIKNSKLLSKCLVVQSDVQAMNEKRRLKVIASKHFNDPYVNCEHGLSLVLCSCQFRELEFEVTSESANIGAAVAAIFR
jgi:hypothetical protein